MGQRRADDARTGRLCGRVVTAATALLLLASPAAAEPCLELSCAPQVPDRPSAWDQWRSATEQVMAGKGAPVLYRDTSNRMRAWWVLYEHDRETPWLDESDANRARELAEVGTIAGLEALLRETFERSEELGIVYRIGKTATGADLEIRRRSGRTRLAYNARSPGQLRAAELELDDDHARRDNGSDRTLRTGVAMQVVDVDESEEAVDPALMLTSYLDLRRMGPDALRLQIGDTAPWGKLKEERGQWSVTLRQGLLPSLDAFGRLSGQESRSWLPSRAASGLSLRLPTPTRWYLRSELSRTFPEPEADESSQGEWRAMLYLRAQLRWELPASSSGWPLGEVVDPANRALLPE